MIKPDSELSGMYSPTKKRLYSSVEEGNELNPIECFIIKASQLPESQVKFDHRNPISPLSLFNHNNVWESREQSRGKCRCVGLDLSEFMQVQFKDDVPFLFKQIVELLIGLDID